MDIVERFRSEIPEATVTEGTPQTDEEIDALQEELGIKLPDDCRQFLRDHGAVRIQAETPDFYGDIVVWGVGLDDLDIRAGMGILDEECRSWSRAPLGMLPLIGHYPGDVEDTYILDPKGKLHFHYRGHAERGQAKTLTEALEFAFENLQESLKQLKADRATEGAVLDAVGGSMSGGPGSMLADLAGAFPSRRGDKAVYLTNRNGHEIEVRMGDGREFHIGLGNLPGLFFMWYEPAAGRTVGDIAKYNDEAFCARGSLVGDKVRFRGRVLLSKLDFRSVAMVLAHDAHLDIEDDKIGYVLLTPDHVRDYFLAKTQGYFSDFKSHSVEDDGNATFHYKGTYGDAQMTLWIEDGGRSAWLETRIPCGQHALDEIQQKLNGYNRGLPLIKSDQDVNFDMEHFARFKREGDRISIGHRVLANSFDLTIDKASGLDPFIDEIAGGKKHAMRELDIAEPLPLANYEDALGLPFGPLAKELAQRYLRMKVSYGMPFGEVARGVRWLAEYGDVKKEAYATPWGPAHPFMEAQVRVGFDAESYVIALIEGGKTTDDCVCIAYQEWGEREGEARVVAKDLRDLLSLFAINTPGVDIVDEHSAAHARRRYYASYYEQKDFIEWLQTLGIEPANDPLALVQASGLDRDGKIDLSKNLREAT